MEELRKINQVLTELVDTNRDLVTSIRQGYRLTPIHLPSNPAHKQILKNKMNLQIAEAKKIMNKRDENDPKKKISEEVKTSETPSTSKSDLDKQNHQDTEKRLKENLRKRIKLSRQEKVYEALFRDLQLSSDSEEEEESHKRKKINSVILRK